MRPLTHSLSSFAFAICLLAGCAAESAPAIGLRGAPAGAPLEGKQLALGKAHGCSLDAAISGVLCWGDDRSGQTDVPALSAPSFIAAGGDTSCAIDGGRVRCWGDDAHGQLRVPRELRAPLQLAVGEGHVCALSEGDAVSCWGDDSHGQLQVPALGEVDAIAAGASHSCAIGAGKVTCWGESADGRLHVPSFEAPEQLALGGDHACVIDSGAVKCWGGRVRALLDHIPRVSHPVLLATGASHACVLDDAGVQCWGDGVAGDLTPRELTQPTQLAVGGGDGWAHACARHLQGVACWGANTFHQSEYDGGPLHVLHRSESNIDAPADKVWSVLLDLDRYPEWNPYTVAMRSTLQVGDPMVMSVKMSELLTIEQTEYIRVVEENHKICWGIDTDTPEFNSGERCQWLEEIPGGGTHYVSEDLIEGIANPLVTALFGDAVQNGFDAVALALKRRVEAL
jgi:hypothetical protein